MLRDTEQAVRYCLSSALVVSQTTSTLSKRWFSPRWVLMPRSVNIMSSWLNSDQSLIGKINPCHFHRLICPFHRSMVACGPVPRPQDPARASRDCRMSVAAMYNDADKVAMQLHERVDFEKSRRIPCFGRLSIVNQVKTVVLL